MRAHIKGIILPHLPHQLVAYPLPHSRVPLLVKPTPSLHLPYHPFLLALLRKHPAEPRVVRRAPEGEVAQEEYLGNISGEDKEEDYL